MNLKGVVISTLCFIGLLIILIAGVYKFYESKYRQNLNSKDFYLLQELKTLNNCLKFFIRLMRN